MFKAFKTANLTNIELIGIAAIIVLVLLIPPWVSIAAAVGLSGFAGCRIYSAKRTN